MASEAVWRTLCGHPGEYSVAALQRCDFVDLAQNSFSKRVRDRHKRVTVCIEIPGVSGRERKAPFLRKCCLKSVGQLPAPFAAQSGSAIGNFHSDRETREVIKQRSASTSRRFGLESDQNLRTSHNRQHRVRPDRPEVVCCLVDLVEVVDEDYRVQKNVRIHNYQSRVTVKSILRSIPL
jgi:hypothetical protein